MESHDRELSRRRFLGSVGVAAGGAVVGGGLVGAETAFGRVTRRPATPNAALEALMAGNARYRKGQWKRRDYSPVGERRASSQKPFAAILSCADSRVSPPLVFDLERGNLFSAQIAGNAVDAGTLGSIEYAVAVLGVPLVMVLGHSDCGAVQAAMGVAAGTASYPAEQYGAIGGVVDHVVPAVQTLEPAERTLERCIERNANVQAQLLRATNPIIAPRVADGRLRVVGAVYDIATGRVELA
jgi:carbonic anhydrase